MNNTSGAEDIFITCFTGLHIQNDDEYYLLQIHLLYLKQLDTEYKENEHVSVSEFCNVVVLIGQGLLHMSSPQCVSGSAPGSHSPATMWWIRGLHNMILELSRILHRNREKINVIFFLVVGD